MSANLVVDLGNTTVMGLSIGGTANAQSGLIYSASGPVIGLSVDLLQANAFCNLFAGGYAQNASGFLNLQVQCSDFDTSGSYVDPTSGLAQFPTSFLSGGMLVLNSGNTGGVLGAQVSGQSILSGFMVSAGFQRPFRYARVNVLSGGYNGPLVAGFIAAAKTTGSGGGFTFLPTSGLVSV